MANEKSFLPSWNGGSVGQSRVSFRSALRRASEQIAPQFFNPEEQKCAEELRRIIALVYTLDDDAEFRIGDEKYPGSVVKEVFELLTPEHVRTVMYNFDGVKYVVNSKRAYLTAALFNSVFELETGLTNLANTL